MITARLIKSHCGFDQGLDLLEFDFGPRCIGRVALGIRRIGTVDQHGDREARYASRLEHFRFCGAGNLVIDGLFAARGCLTRSRRRIKPGLIGIRQVVADGDAVISRTIRARRRILDRLRGACNLAIRIECVGCPGYTVVVHLCGNLDSHLVGTDDALNDVFDICPQAIFVGRTAFLDR